MKKIIIGSIVLNIVLFSVLLTLLIGKPDNVYRTLRIEGDIENYKVLHSKKIDVNLWDYLKKTKPGNHINNIYLFSSNDKLALSIKKEESDLVRLKYSNDLGYYLRSEKLPRPINLNSVDRIVVDTNDPEYRLKIFNEKKELSLSDNIATYLIDGSNKLTLDSSPVQENFQIKKYDIKTIIDSPIRNKDYYIMVQGGEKFKCLRTKVSKFLIKDGKFYYSKNANKDYKEIVGLSLNKTFTKSDFKLKRSFVFFGDLQNSENPTDYTMSSKLISRALKKFRPDMVLQSGDLTETNSLEEWTALSKAFIFPIEKRLKSNFNLITTSGNHEFTEYINNKIRLPKKYNDYLMAWDNKTLNEAYQKMMLKKDPYFCSLNYYSGKFKNQFYSVDINNLHILSLTSNYLNDLEMPYKNVGMAQNELKRINQWIANDLKFSTAKFNIVLMHNPVLTLKDDAINQKILSEWMPIFKENSVDLLLCGHQHEIMRSSPFTIENGKLTKSKKGIVQIMINTSTKSYNNENRVDELISFRKPETAGLLNITATKNKLELGIYNENMNILDYSEIGR